MRKKILMGFLMFMIPMFVYADEIIVDCPSEVATNNEFTCTISGKSDKIVTAISADVKSDTATFISFTNGGGWLGDGNEGDVELYTADDKTGTFDIGIVKFKSGTVVSSIVVNNVIYYDEYGVAINGINSVSKNVNIKKDVSNSQNNNNNNNIQDDNSIKNENNTDNDIDIEDKETDNNDNVETDIVDKSYLVDLDINGYELDFDSNIYEYSLIIKDEEKLQIIPKLNNDDYTYEIRNNNNLVDGSIIEIEVISKFDDTNRTLYKININKEYKNMDYSIIFIVIIILLVIINIVRIILNIKKRRVLTNNGSDKYE